MSSVSGSYRNGHVELESPVDWPEGMRVVILQADLTEEADVPHATAEGWPNSPDERAALVARMEARLPLEFTAQDRAEIEAAQEEVRRYTLEAMQKQWTESP